MSDPEGRGPVLCLRELGGLGRVGIACIAVVLMGGLAASGGHVFFHHGPKDDVKGLSLDDIMGAYHGVQAPARLPATLDRGHPEKTDAASREALLNWLLGPKKPDGSRPEGGGKRIAEDYDNLDLGDMAPNEIIARNCLSCHSRKVADANPIARTIPLDQRDDVIKLSLPKKLTPVPREILVASTHAHALSLGTLSVAIAGLALATNFSRRAVWSIIGCMGIGLLADLGGQWVANLFPAGAPNAGLGVAGVYVLLVGGAVFAAAAATGLVAVLIDVCLPRRS